MTARLKNFLIKRLVAKKKVKPLVSQTPSSSKSPSKATLILKRNGIFAKVLVQY